MRTVLNIINYTRPAIYICLALSLVSTAQRKITTNFPYQANIKIEFPSWGLNGAYNGPIKVGRVMPPLSRMTTKQGRLNTLPQ